MGEFESKFIYTYIKDKILLNLRSIDDLFSNWKGTGEELLVFFKTINKAHPSLKFHLKYSYDRIVFLDTKLYKRKTASYA